MGKLKDKVFKMPVPVKITGRSSSITNAFFNGIIPVIEPSDEEVAEALDTLGMTEDSICCAYCGDRYTEWDHLNPLIENKQPTGYVSEIHNLVPVCGKCNQSKGNKYWKTWMLSDATLSPASRNIPDIDERIKRLEQYAQKYHPKRYNFRAIVGNELWEQHLQNCDDVQKKMRESQQLSDKIKKIISDAVVNENMGTGFAGPAIGIPIPKGSTIKRRPDGLIEIITPEE